MPNGSPDETSKPVIFGAHAVELRQAGLAVLPADGKRPTCRNFNKWHQAPGVNVVEQWARAHPHANIVYIPGLSRTPKSPHGLVVVDADSPDEFGRVEQHFGYTPAMIATRRGRHFIYRADGASLGNIGSLRHCGYHIDIKHGQNGSGISVAPPSRHPDRPDFVYSWYSNSGLAALSELPTFNSTKLEELISQSKTLRHATEQSEPLRNVTYTAPPSASRLGLSSPQSFRDGSRKLALNDYLCAQAGFFDDIDDCLDAAWTWIDNYFDRWGVPKLPDEEVLEVCRSVLADSDKGKLVRTLGLRAIAVSDADEIRWLTKEYQNGDAALTLLLLFRAEHTARCLRGETFAICIEAMVNAETLGGWSARRYRDARDVLLSLGLIELVSESCGPRAAQYRLAERRPTPSVALSGKRANKTS